MGDPYHKHVPLPSITAYRAREAKHIGTGIRANNRGTKAVEPKALAKGLSEVVPVKSPENHYAITAMIA